MSEERSVLVTGGKRSKIQMVLDASRRLAALPETLKRNFEIEKAKLEGRAQSQARLIIPIAEIKSAKGKLKPGTPEPTDVMVRDKRGRPMVYYTDGSLRHILGAKPSGKAVKAARRKQREALAR